MLCYYGRVRGGWGVWKRLANGFWEYVPGDVLNDVGLFIWPEDMFTESGPKNVSRFDKPRAGALSQKGGS